LKRQKKERNQKSDFKCRIQQKNLNSSCKYANSIAINEINIARVAQHSLKLQSWHYTKLVFPLLWSADVRRHSTSAKSELNEFHIYS